MLRLRCLALALVVALGSIMAQRASADPHMPPDTEMVVSIHAKQLLDSAFLKDLLGPARDLLKEVPDVAKVLDGLGFDPFRDLDRVILASPSNPGKDRGLLIAQGKFDVAKLEAKAAALEKEGSDVLKLHKIGDGKGGQIKVYELAVPGGETPFFLGLSGATTLVASPGKDYVVEAIRRARARKPLALKNKPFEAMLERMDPKQTISIAVLGKALDGDLLKGSPDFVKDTVAKIDALGGGVTFGADVRFEVTVACKNDADARALKETGDRGLQLGLAGLALVAGENKGLAAALEVVKTLRLTSKGKVITLKGKLSPDAIKDALER